MEVTLTRRYRQHGRRHRAQACLRAVASDDRRGRGDRGVVADHSGASDLVGQVGGGGEG